jgi:fatty acid desaturase
MSVETARDPVPERARVGDLDSEVVAHALVADLHAPRPVIFWTDMVTSAVLGWSAFALTVAMSRSFSISMLAAGAIAALALYRGVCFTHELAHLRRSALPGFETAWNMLFGVPLLLPSFTYLGVHQSHHSLSTYGTKDDPEYLPFADSRRLMIAFGLQSSLLLPFLMVIRFIVLSPIALVWPAMHRWLEVYASSFAMNPEYRRTVAPEMASKMRRWEAAIVACWGLALLLIYRGVLPSRTLLVWLAIMVAVSLLNTVRVLGAHEYETDGSARSREGQLRDSIDTPGGWWTESWAPVGLRYHALHHYFPGIPYHNLGNAYRRLARRLPAASVYRESTSPSLQRSLHALYMRAKARRRAAPAGSTVRTPGA